MPGLPWIKVWTVVGDHPKVQRLERELGTRDALGVVVRLWCWTADYHPDGDIPEESMEAMARAARGPLPTPTDAVRRGLRAAGLLDPIPGGFRVHDWADVQIVHVEAEEKRRVQARERQSRHRARNAGVTRDVTRDSVTEIKKEIEIEIKSDWPAVPINGGSPVVYPGWLAGIAERLSLELGKTLAVGKDATAVVDAFTRLRDAYVADGRPDPDGLVLEDCRAVVRKSRVGPPETLSFFVGWINNAVPKLSRA